MKCKQFSTGRKNAPAKQGQRISNISFKSVSYCLRFALGFGIQAKQNTKMGFCLHNCRGSVLKSSWVIVLGIFVFALTVKESSSQLQSKCYEFDDRRRPQRCMPEFGNAAFGKRVVSNNTCGTPPSKFCFQTGVLDVRKECEVCDAFDKRFAHPASFITDIKDDQNKTWWQSQTLLDTSDKTVTLTLDLGKSYDVSYIRIRFRSPRPESMAIYKRTSYERDSKWIPYQYFSSSCRKTFGVEANGIVTRRNQQIPLCTDAFSSISPLTGGNVAFSTLEERPDAYDFDNSPALQEWVTAVSIRIDLVRMNTFGDELFGDQIVLSSYYYAIIDLSVGGRCKCNGHAARCEEKALSDGTVRLQCECEHNTAGVDCEKCLPLFNDRPWARASPTNPNVCMPCRCNDLADSCVFDPTLYRETGRGGRCINCKRNTDGPNCERCKENFFRSRSTDPCLSCNCNRVGSESLQCNSAGQCRCKPGVTGVKCDRCLPNYFGFSQTGCRPCQCVPAGTDPAMTQCNEKGECNCKRHVVGAKCTQCRSGYFGLEETNPHGCKQCFCYGHSTVCRPALGYTSRNITTDFTTGLEGWTVLNKKEQDVTDQYAVHSQRGFISMTAIGKEVLYAKASLVFYSNRRSSYGQTFGFKFRVGSTEGVAVDFADIVLEGEDNLKVSTQLTSQGNPLPTTSFQSYVYRLHEDPSFGWEPRLTGYDFQRLLTSLKSIKIRMNYADQGTGMLDEVFFESAIYDPTSARPVTWVEQCSCPAQYRGNNCEFCNEGFTREGGAANKYGLCVPCQCYGHSDSCDPDTGKCLCKHNTTGIKCDKCQDGFYGNPTQGTPNDCKPCPCKFGTRCIQIGASIVCTDCPPGHVGNLCDRCQDGYYGDPMGLKGSPTLCEKCNCSGNIDPNAIGSCDSQTGDCLKCIYNTRNGPMNQCELCAIGYYGNATAYPKPQCVACECYAQGTVAPPGHDPSLPFPCDSKGRCQCLPNVVGDKCDSCIPEYWNVGSGRGCEQCNCDVIGAWNNSCDVKTGQCHCKPGVTGRQCDMCKVDHYSFSKLGCLACNCNKEGSLNVSCNEQGVCECRPGVLGIKCDTCRENYHNLTAGCISCPPCYDVIQKLAHGLRRKLHELIYIIDRFNSSSKVVVDVDFESRLKELTERVNKLLKQAEKANATDRVLVRQISQLDARVERVRMKLIDVWSNSTAAYVTADHGAGNVSVAESSLNVSRHLLEMIKMLLLEDGARALNETIKNVNSTGEQEKRMIEIVKETTKLADKHEAHADEITTKASQALNASEEVVKVVDEAVDTQNKTSIDIEDLHKRLAEVENFQVAAKYNATTANERSAKALEEAKELYENGTAPLPELNITALEAQANASKTEALATKEKSNKIIEDLKGLVSSFNEKEDDVRRKMAEWPGLLEHLKKLLGDIDNANATAWESFLKGEETLKKALKMKETLEKFNSIIEKSRKEAEKAEQNIPEIERLIEMANKKSDNATENLGDAQKLSSEAKAKANEAKTTAQYAQKKAEKIRMEAENLTLPRDTVSEPAKKAAAKILTLKDKASKEKVAIDDAKVKAANASSAAKRARTKIDEVLKKLLELLKDIDTLDTIDINKLNALEDRLDKEIMGARTLDGMLNNVTETHRIIRERIKEYTVDIARLKKEMSKLEGIYNATLEVCRKRTTENEGK